VQRILFSTCGVEPTQKFIPACTHHYDVLNSYNLGAFQQIAPGDGHGPMHVQLGGMRGGCNEAYAAFQEKWGAVLAEDVNEEIVNALGYTGSQTKAEMEESGLIKWKWGQTAPRQLMIDKAIMGEYFHIYRSLWRSHMCAVDGRFQYLVCPETCDNFMNYEDCSCQVEALVSGRTTWQNLFPCVLNSEENQRDFMAAMPEEMLSDMVTMIATSSVIEGDMIESSSPADPLFWMIHPVIERLLSAKRLPDVKTMGSKAFYKWEDMGGTSEHWVSYSFYDLGLNECPSHRQPYTCEGHAATDPVLPEDITILTDALEKVADFDGDGTVTNYEFYTALDPNAVEYNDYVFDNFNWNHCE
jgi:hypothetical protein